MNKLENKVNPINYIFGLRNCRNEPKPFHMCTVAQKFRVSKGFSKRKTKQGAETTLLVAWLRASNLSRISEISSSETP